MTEIFNRNSENLLEAFSAIFFGLNIFEEFLGRKLKLCQIVPMVLPLPKHQEILYCRSNAETVSKIPEKKTKFENLKTSLKDALISKIPKAFFNVGPIPIHTWLFPGNIQTYFRYAISFYL